MAQVQISGWASTPDIDHAGHIVRPDAFTASIKRRGLSGPQGIKLLAQHDNHKVVGRITALEPSAHGLWLQGYIEDEISYGKDLALASEAAGGLSFSVGFFPQDADLLRKGDYEYLEIIRGDLFEVSVVTFPCNDYACMTSYEKRRVNTPKNDKHLAQVDAMTAKLRQFNQQFGG